MTAIPCDRDDKARQRQVDAYVEALKLHAHEIGQHGLSEHDFYESGFFRAAMERIRGQNSARMTAKREFAKNVLNLLQDGGFIAEWAQAGNQNRFDYEVHFSDGYVAVIELKGCMDGNNTNIFERPTHAREFLVWSVCANKLSNMARNAWSGVHVRLGPEIIEKKSNVDGLIVWDWSCNSRERPCPKLRDIENPKLVSIGGETLPPPCIYVFPSTVPSARNNAKPRPHKLEELRLLQAFHKCFGGDDRHLHFVELEVMQKGQETVRRTTISRDGIEVKASKFIPIRRK